MSTLFTGWTFAEDASVTADLTIRVLGLRSSRGSVAIALFDSPAAYDSRRDPVSKAFVVIEDRTCQWVIPDLPRGDYAAMLYHDRNDNGTLDKLPIGAPKEPYGFSNGARGTFGPPSFEKAKFALDGDRAIEIRLK